MNLIEIKAPRWKDRMVLIAKWKIGNQNKIVIQSRRKDGSLFYPEPIIVNGDWIYEHGEEERHAHGPMIAVPLADLLDVEARIWN